MDLSEHAAKPERPAKRQAVSLTSYRAGACLTLQVGTHGAETQASAHRLAELGVGAQVGRRNGATAVVLAIRA